MQIGISYPIDGEQFVAITLQSDKGIITEGLSPDLARQYADMMVKCADLLDKLKSDAAKEGSEGC